MKIEAFAHIGKFGFRFLLIVQQLCDAPGAQIETIILGAGQCLTRPQNRGVDIEDLALDCGKLLFGFDCPVTGAQAAINELRNLVALLCNQLPLVVQAFGFLLQLVDLLSQESHLPVHEFAFALRRVEPQFQKRLLLCNAQLTILPE